MGFKVKGKKLIYLRIIFYELHLALRGPQLLIFHLPFIAVRMFLPENRIS